MPDSEFCCGVLTNLLIGRGLPEVFIVVFIAGTKICYNHNIFLELLLGLEGLPNILAKAFVSRIGC